MRPASTIRALERVKAGEPISTDTARRLGGLVALLPEPAPFDLTVGARTLHMSFAELTSEGRRALAVADVGRSRIELAGLVPLERVLPTRHLLEELREIEGAPCAR